VESLHKELTDLHKKRVFHQVLSRNLSDTQRRSIIRSKIFLKEKFFPSGLFDKLKFRLVAGGDMQDRSDYVEDETSSPTVSLSSVYLVASIAAREKRKVGTADIGTAYLNAAIAKPVYMKIDKRLAQMLVEIFPDDYSLDKDGCVYVKLDKALYGCVESAKLWYDEVSSTLLALGFVRNPHDICVFNLERNGHQMTVYLYMDDLLMTTIDESDIDWLTTELRKKYETATLNVGEVHSYLGQTFDFGVEGEVSVSMDGYIRDILDASHVKGYKATPAGVDLYDIDASLAVAESGDQDDFRSLVMRLMFLAQRARPDILTPVAFLSRRCGKCTSEDQGKLTRVLMYLNSWPDLKMTLACEEDLRVYRYVDASFAVHQDMKSHTGAIISLGRGSVNVSSKKQQLMTKSSTESELVGLSDQLPQVIWTRNFLLCQGYQVGAVVIFQDNQSTIALVAKGRSTSARTRHIAHSDEMSCSVEDQDMIRDRDETSCSVED
jgi:Reverse transcriptase (RNA-dependent DNA polymerase)